MRRETKRNEAKHCSKMNERENTSNCFTFFERTQMHTTANELALHRKREHV